MPFSDVGRAVEDRFHRDVIPVLRRRQWRPRAIAYDGYGVSAAPGRYGSMARVLARMVMRPKGAPSEGPLFRHIPDQAPSSAAQVRHIALDSLLDAQRGWRQFIDVPVPYLPVTITVGSAQVRTRTDRGGYVDVVVRDHDLEPGWHEVSIEAAGAGRVTTQVHIIAPGPRLGIVSDIDDTVMVTNVPRALIAGWNLLMRNAANREVVPGMPGLLTALDEADSGTPLMYLSTGAWNVVPTLRSFFTRHGLPRAPMLMTDWGPTNTGWFRDGIEHKRTELRRLLIDLPDVQWILIGDDGQHDPLIYSELVREHANRVAAVAIRRLSHKELVLAGSQFVNPMGVGPAARTLAEADVPVVSGRDGAELAEHLREALGH